MNVMNENKQIKFRTLYTFIAYSSCANLTKNKSSFRSRLHIVDLDFMSETNQTLLAILIACS
jgi:hypothetical protein